jgi:HEAT repeat protein
LETDLTDGQRGVGSLVGELKWDIGTALRYLVNETVVDEIIELALDRRHGQTRQMIVLALGNMKDPRAVDVAIELLDDDDVAGHALSALVRLNDEKARRHFERFANHPRDWWRKTAKKGLSKLDKTREARLGGHASC